jgi:serine/threonine protein kinase/tetratricopeptide (TPR) repeat protein
MAPENWTQVKTLFEAALAQETSQRAAFLAQNCPDAELRREVEKLLANYAEAGSFLSGPALQVPRRTSEVTAEITAGFGSQGAGISHYRILEKLGGGGMGEVWLAEQRQPVRRRVAIKLIKAGMDTREVVARFESERQALALMDHPAIAKVFDAGSTPQGRPYFVMEYVPGMPITDYCDKHKLTLRQRLELFVAVCDGVQHAHQKAILHRDLKPSNILVGEVDGKPAPRIIDFGVAKATAQRLTADTMFTRVGAIIGTPGYMSPEQADSAGTDVDTRTDVYSLGVVLYELLVGVLPLDLSKMPPDQALRRLREDEVSQPSTRLRTLGDQTGITARNRGADGPTLARQLRGDVDAIALKALEKDRSRRYATPSDLAADIGRYLRHEPVIARPASAAYRAGKYIRRHRMGVAVAVGLVAVLVSFGVAQTLQLRRTITERDRANRERDRANRERDRATRITGFMTGMFKVSDPSAARGNSITAREILDKASKEIDTGLSKDPELQAQMMQTMGEVYDSLGLEPQAQSLLTRAVDIRRRVLGPQNPDTLTSMSRLGGILMLQGRYAEAEKLQRETLDSQRRVLGMKHPDTLKSMNYLAVVLREDGRYVEAEKLLREALDIERRVLGPEHPDTLQSINNLASVIYFEGRYAEAETLFRETLNIQRRALGMTHPDTLQSMDDLANVLGDQGRYAEAEKLSRETLEIQRRVLGPEHSDTLAVMSNLAGLLESQGRYAEAEKLFRETLEIQRRVLGPEHPLTALSTASLGEMLAHKGDRDGALAFLREAVDHGLRPAADLDIGKNPNLQSLHGDPRFAALVAHAKERAAAAQKPH